MLMNLNLLTSPSNNWISSMEDLFCIQVISFCNGQDSSVDTATTFPKVCRMHYV